MAAAANALNGSIEVKFSEGFWVVATPGQRAMALKIWPPTTNACAMNLMRSIVSTAAPPLPSRDRDRQSQSVSSGSRARLAGFECVYVMDHPFEGLARYRPSRASSSLTRTR
jgi:hypothetical protein